MESSTDCAKEQVCLEQDESTIRSLYERLQRVPDQRKARGKRYEAAVVLTLLVLAKLAGETKMSGIAQWARLRVEWLSQVLSLHAGKAPCANTYQYVCDRMDKSALEAELVETKGKEPATAMSLVEQLDLKGCVVSADALHTRPKWCRAVRQRGGHYLLIVKGNRPELYEDISFEKPCPAHDSH